MSELEKLIRETIAVEGALSVASYMQLALQHPVHGYYVKGDPLGARGDFVTAPEISQMFGELMGVWCAEVWRQMGSPDPFVLLELGPGRGSLLADALGATERVDGFHRAMQLHLMESNDTLRVQQQEKLAAFAPAYIDDLSKLPDLPLIVIANEFFDALPIHQYRKTSQGWREVGVGLDEAGQLAFVERPQNVPLPLPEALGFYELSPVAVAMAQELAARIVRNNGAALVIDYGYAEPDGQNTLQAVADHKQVDPLASPGQQDLTAHVDFAALRLAAEKQGARVLPLVGQGDFLKNLGIDIRASQLKTRASAEGAAQIDADVTRLTDDMHMGVLFKALAFTHSKMKEIPGFP